MRAIAGIGTFLGGYLSDRLSSRAQRSALVHVGAGVGDAHVRAVPVPGLSVADLAVALPSFVGLMLMAAVFFGPSFAMTQALATLRMRSVATSVLLFIQTLIGNGLGPSVTG